MTSTLTYLAEAERRGALGRAASPYLCNCDICHHRPAKPEEHEMTDTHEPLIAGSPRSLTEVVECVKQTGGAVEIQGVRIEPCDERGETATTRNLTNVMESLGQMESGYVQARDWAAWFAAEAVYWKTEADLYHTVAAQNYETDGATVASLDAERTELQARVAELEAAQSRCQTTTAIAVWDGVADGRSIWCELPDGHDGKHHATVRQPGNVDATVDWGNPPTERIGYAVGYCLDSEFVSLGSDTLYTAPAEAADELAAAQSESPATPFRVYELREVRGEGAPSAAPAGYAVVTRNPEGGLHRSATVWDDLERATAAGDVASRYADGTGCSAAVYALREVTE